MRLINLSEPQWPCELVGDDGGAYFRGAPMKYKAQPGVMWSLKAGLITSRVSQVALVVKNHLPMQET